VEDLRGILASPDVRAHESWGDYLANPASLTLRRLIPIM
jgi:hypothetical protein